MISDSFRRFGGAHPLAAAVCCLSSLCPSVARAAEVTFQKHDRIALVGNATADRMQHHNGLEALLAKRFAEHDLVFRNLAAAGDEVVTRSRSENFGSPEDWLDRVRASVVFGFFGYNESFRGYDGLPGFKTELESWVRQTKARKTSGADGTRIVLFSPIAVESRAPFNAPGDPEARNALLAQYATAIAEVARAEGVGFVDLFGLSQKAFATANGPLTHNGWQLTAHGDAALAPLVFQALTGETTIPAVEEPLRSAIADKNHQWHQRYRTIDGYNVYGGRSQMEYQSGPNGPMIKNYQVMQEEMAVRDAMTANRDVRIHALARGRDIPVDDSNLPKVTEVKTNKPGDRPDGTHTYLGGEEAIAKMTVHDGCEVNLFASEEQFPDLINPVQMAWDTRNRLWVAAWRNYPGRTPWSAKGDTLLVLEDTDRDGRADTATPFLDNLNAPTGFQFYRDGVLLMQGPDVLFVRDTDGDGRGDWHERVLMGMDSADSHHATNAMALDPGGAVYLSDGVFHRTQVETARGPVRTADGAIFRFEPRTGVFETHVKYGFANPHGKVFDRWGNDLVTDATGNNTYFAPAFSGRLDSGDHAPLKEFWARPSRPSPGTAILSSRHFPDDWQGNFLNCNVISFHGIFRARVTEDGSGLKGDTMPNLISSTDPNFRPTAVNVGPDGALYIADWQNAIIGHLQHHLRDPNRDHSHGCIYRLIYKSRPLLEPTIIAGAPIPNLLDLLKSPEDNVRERAKIELGARDTDSVIKAARQWVAALDPAAPEVEHHRMEALWVHQWHHVIDADFLALMLRSPEPRARAAATRLLGNWREFLPNPLALLAPMATDDHPRVRLEAVRVASFFRDVEAANIALASLAKPRDYYLDYVLGETMRQLEPYWRQAIADGRPFAPDNPAGLDYVLNRVSSDELLKLPRTPTVLAALLTRPDVASTARLEALATLAEQKQSSVAAEIVAVLQSATASPTSADLAGLLPGQGVETLRPVRGALASLATEAPSPAIQAAATAALVVADGSWDDVVRTAQLATGTGLARRLTTALAAVPLVPDTALRARADETLRKILTAPPDTLAAHLGVGRAAPGRFVRIELPRQGTLTLAEVEVVSGSQNVARAGKARQSSTANDGRAERAIDGNTSPDWGRGGQTHTAEDEANPWWELDLGQDTAIESITVYNRWDGENRLRQRLDGFTLTVLDAARQPVFEKKNLPAPADSATISVDADPVALVRDAAARALASTGVQPEETAILFSTLLAQGEVRPAVVRALRSLPRQAWQPTPSLAAARALLEWARAIPAADRTAPAVVESLQLAHDLASLSPDDTGRTLLRDLRAISVNVFVIRTVREQMRYDTPRFVVEAGKPFEIIFENADALPHNLVVSLPGTKEAVATAAQTMPPTQLDADGRAYLHPDSMNVVLAATRMLEPGQSQTLKLTAPTTPGAYDYVCTFPGHWTIMHGTLEVVAAP
jgi:azurin/glucose/arabinose dehydrogenase